MKRSTLFIFLLTVIAMSSCYEELKSNLDETDVVELDESELKDATLDLSVKEFVVDTKIGTRTPDPSLTPEEETEEEKAIHNIWVFQYDAVSKKLLLKPRYYIIEDQAILKNLPVLLRPDTGNSIVYVVANTNDLDWASDVKWKDFNELELLQKQILSKPFPIQLNNKDVVSIPMSGASVEVKVTAKSTVTVPVTRMYAKIKVKVNIKVDELSLAYITVGGIPEYCQVKSLIGDTWNESKAVEYPDNVTFVSRSFTAEEKDEKGWTTIYVPENIQGENGNQESSDKSKNVPAKAVFINAGTQHKNDPVHEYKVYPGGNNYNNFNIKRNNVYRVIININAISEQNKPSSNCFIVKPGESLSFEPYYRVEKGGGYDIASYLNPDDEDLRIARVGIIWQTKDCIGDNTDEANPLVWLEGSGKDQKINVKTNKEGNALIAAYNKDGRILWSWHIWVTGNEPDNLGKAIVYTTYPWDEKGIYSDQRVSGYAVMSCNLGALSDTQSGTASDGTLLRYPADQTKAFGLLYQWGRKDPFPPLRIRSRDLIDYNDNTTDIHYDNSNKTPVKKTSSEDNSYLFHSVIGDNLPETAVKYAIAHPTVFITGTRKVNQGYSYISKKENYFNNGDWCPVGESDDKLWGGEEPNDPGMKCLVIDAKEQVHLYDNYGVKSIFDPCPMGWRVAPGELWLGFSKTGFNPESDDEINFEASAASYGMNMYMRDWRSDATSYFPTQGTRAGDGMGYRVGDCGNYHNATTDINNRVNILHIHNAYALFHIFEYQFYMYYVKSVAGPIRCVRDTK